MPVAGSGELVLPGHQGADELEAVVPLRLEESPDVTAHGADALALGGEQGFEPLFPEGTLQGQAAKYRPLAQAKGQVLIRGGRGAARGLEPRMLILQLREPGPPLALGKGP